MKPLRSRFQKELDESVQQYTESISYDRRLWKQDISGSIAHAKMLVKQEIISKEEAALIIEGLVHIWQEVEQGKFQAKPELEDIHMNIESRLTEMIGETAGKLHTARSRNDQVALDLRLFMLKTIEDTNSGIRELQSALVELAESNKSLVMPGYTHLQRAQPVLLAHHLLAYFEMLERDAQRLQDCYKRTDVLPLGSGALAGVTYPIDRLFLAKELGFSMISMNSLDAVSDRDFVIEYQAAASIAMMHLSRLAEELVIWSSEEFGFIEIDDAYATTSSIMPQKKNPDVAELGRGKTGRVYGNLLGILTTMKSLPLSYNRDMQEDKEGLFDTVDTLLSTLEVFAGMVSTLKVNTERTSPAAGEGYILATDVADYLAKKGLPFRLAHQAVAQLVSYAIEQGKDLQQLKLAEYQRFSKLFDKDILKITADSSLAARDIPGGTSPQQVMEQLARAKGILGKNANKAKDQGVIESGIKGKTSQLNMVRNIPTVEAKARNTQPDIIKNIPVAKTKTTDKSQPKKKSKHSKGQKDDG